MALQYGIPTHFAHKIHKERCLLLIPNKTGDRPYRGSHVIKEFAEQAGVSNMSVFTFTNLRKQVATLSQSLEISKLDQDQLATFLGHDIRVHRGIYRLPISTLEKAKVAKILLAVNRGVRLDKVEEVNEEEEIEQDGDENENLNEREECSSDEDLDLQVIPSEDRTVKSTDADRCKL